MALQNNHHHHSSSEQTQEQESHFFLLDALYCEEEQRWEEEGEEEGVEDAAAEDCIGNGRKPSSLLPLLLLEQDLFWEDEELLSLFSKEEAQQEESGLGTEQSVSSGSVRGEAVERMLRVSAHYGFSALTAVLAIDYVDRFLSRFRVQSDKPWMIQLVAVACVSMAAKVEETYVPFLLDLQVGEAKYVFEAKAIQTMELLVLSTLKWKMHPVTPLSFLDHIIRRLGLKSEVHWEFFRRCEALLLSVVSDSRSVGYLPSVLATATMMHVIEEVETDSPIEYEAQLLRVLRMSKEKVDGCYQLILGISKARNTDHGVINLHKRKSGQIQSSSRGATESSLISSTTDDISNEDHHHQPLVKRSRVQLLEKSNSCNNAGGSLLSLGRVFMNAVRSPH
ncbi:cyclin-D3-1-like [Punica granatum]|uniref:Uncharacterized protein n=2 Tax=Punica granatum TaxID=22663 RepID=A0A218XFK3_PUNGR|nr:cyclin-D3-1-like [Punica granatum]OWM83703.1 hypothetical protein CDL15_Pgr004133 [Punica granatum]PKI75296.1 hypothetical protein CRG98_004336 [Punica granatum]